MRNWNVLPLPTARGQESPYQAFETQMLQNEWPARPGLRSRDIVVGTARRSLARRWNVAGAIRHLFRQWPLDSLHQFYNNTPSTHLQKHQAL